MSLINQQNNEFMEINNEMKKAIINAINNNVDKTLNNNTSSSCNKNTNNNNGNRINILFNYINKYY